MVGDVMEYDVQMTLSVIATIVVGVQYVRGKDWHMAAFIAVINGVYAL
jgi:uncharacterized membrane protein